MEIIFYCEIMFYRTVYSNMSLQQLHVQYNRTY